MKFVSFLVETPVCYQLLLKHCENVNVQNENNEKHNYVENMDNSFICCAYSDKINMNVCILYLQSWAEM